MPAIDDGFDGEVARPRRAELLLLGALLHDIGKGLPGDHSEVGAETARPVGARMRPRPATARSVARVARAQPPPDGRDGDAPRSRATSATIVGSDARCGNTERLDLLYALTIGDSRATGPSAWSSAKASLVRELFVKTDALLERGVVSAP